MIHNETLNDYKNVLIFCTIYIGLFATAFLIIITISIAFTYFHWYIKTDINITNINPDTETVIY